MKKYSRLIIVIMFAGLSLDKPVGAEIAAFPGAEGMGATTVGGRNRYMGTEST